MVIDSDWREKYTRIGQIVQLIKDVAESGEMETVEAGSVKTGNIDTTNEALVEVEKSTTQSISADTWSVVDWDTEVTDVTDDFDLSSDGFTPPETGYYFVQATVKFQVGSDGDLLELRLMSTTTGSKKLTVSETGGASDHSVQLTTVTELQSDEEYQIQAKNTDSSDSITRVATDTYLSINRVIMA